MIPVLGLLLGVVLGLYVQPDVPLGLSGSSSRPHFSKALQDNASIDFAWLGEVDEAVVQWLDATPEARPGLPGVLSRAENGIRGNGVAAPKDLDRKFRSETVDGDHGSRSRWRTLMSCRRQLQAVKLRTRQSLRPSTAMNSWLFNGVS